MARIVETERLDDERVAVTIEGEAHIGPKAYPWRLRLECSRDLYLEADGSGRPRAEILGLLKTHIFSELVT